MPHGLNPPHGGWLVSPMAEPARAERLRADSRGFASLDLTPMQLCDLELLLNGSFSPLGGFMSRADYESVCTSLRLPDGLLWPIPITLDVPEPLASGLRSGDAVALRDPEGFMLAVLHVEDVWR